MTNSTSFAERITYQRPLAASMAKLVAMTPKEFRAFIEWINAHYAEEQVRIGTWEEDEALTLARALTKDALPKGLDTPDQHFLTIRAEGTGARVGDLWYSFRDRGRRRQLFVEWIHVDEKYRRQGYATDVLNQLDAEARKAGAYWVGLGVSGDNTTALSLYAKLGFKAKNIFMAKPPAT
jgi:GNAT superfamily N-acetyltransferase